MYIAKNLVKRMMDPHPNKRITVKEALRHEWFKKALIKNEAAPVSRGNSLSIS